MNRSPLSASFAAVVFSLGAGTAGHAAPVRSSVSVASAWSRPALPGMSTGVIYLTIVNQGRIADRLIGASSPRAAHVGLHRSAMSGGVDTMEGVSSGLEIPAGGAVRLEPHGYHLMMMGLKGGLAAGARFPATLDFAHAGSVKVTVQVRATPPD